MQGKFVQDSVPFRSQKDLRAPAICCRLRPADHSAPLQPVHQTDGAVVPEQEALRKIANAGGLRLHRRDRQHQLVLLRFHTGASGGFFAEMQELAKLMAKLGKGANLLLRNLHQVIS